jgi:hypothetical protein
MTMQHLHWVKSMIVALWWNKISGVVALFTDYKPENNMSGKLFHWGI